MFPKTKSLARTEARELLLEWATKNSQLQDPYVSGLLHALNSNESIGFWSTTSPIDLLPMPSAISRERVNLRYLQLVRNILVFTPVALTWAAVGKSSAAFTSYSVDHIGAPVNFLEFWQNGYGYLASVWRISTIASLDALIIGLLIALTVVIDVRASQRRGRGTSEMVLIESERLSLALKLGEFLYSERDISPASAQVDIKTLTSKLALTSVSIEKITKELEKATKLPIVNRELIALFKKIKATEKNQK